MSYTLLLSSMLLFGFSMCFTPGPNNALAMATGLSKGFRAALPLCFGASTGSNGSLILLGLGFAEVFERFPLIYDVLRYAGSAYMLWLAWRISGLALPRLVPKTGKTRDDAGAEQGGAENGEPSLAVEAAPKADIKPMSFFQAVAFQFVNVKVWLTNVFVATNFIGTGEGMWTRFFLAVGLFTFMGGAANACWAAGGAFMRRFLTSNGMRRANYVFAAFLTLSVALLFIQ